MNPETTIIGAGPAGVAAALQMKRYGLPFRLIEKDRVGGLLRNGRKVENYPGFSIAISGLRLAARLNDHLKACGIPVINDRVLYLDYDEKESQFFMNTLGGQEYRARVVVVASGTRPRPMEQAACLGPALKKKIFHEIVSLLRVKSKKILIVGAGDAAFDYALNLSRDNDIVIINRGGEIRALPCLRTEVLKNKKICYWDQAAVQMISAGEKSALAIRIERAGSSKTIEADFLVCATGRLPQKDFYSGQVKKMEKELVLLKRLVLAGDVKNRQFRQAAIAAGDGLRSAMEIHRKWGSQA